MGIFWRRGPHTKIRHQAGPEAEPGHAERPSRVDPAGRTAPPEAAALPGAAEGPRAASGMLARRCAARLLRYLEVVLQRHSGVF